MKIGDKTFMNLQEAVGWLLENNALPFQSTANYVGNTEIALSTLIAPSPAKVRVGSLIFFADSKVSTVVGLTSNSFIVSDQYNDLVDDIVYVSNVAINASGHLITTLSNGESIDAGLIKQITNFNINASQHLIANYNDGSSTDLGAIFSGNITISGNLTVTGGISGNAITGDSIIENMSGYSYDKSVVSSITNGTIDINFASACKNGNKVTLVIAGKVTTTDTAVNSGTALRIGDFIVPSAIYNNLITLDGVNTLDVRKSLLIINNASFIETTAYTLKPGSNKCACYLRPLSNIAINSSYVFRYEETFLLSDNLAL